MRARSAFLVIALISAVFLSYRAGAQTSAVFQAHCTGCHTVSGTPTSAGQRLGAPNLKSKVIRNRTNEELFQGIAFGNGHKEYPHAFARRGLTDKQIYELIAYIREMQKR